MKSSFFTLLRTRSTLPCLFRRALLGAGLLIASLSAQAGMMSPCQDPIVLPGPQVHVFILPYRAESVLTDRGRQLATIMQRHILFAALKYSSIAVEELTGDPGRCDYNMAASRIVPHLRAGQSAIFLSGRIFEQGDAIRLQSTVSFLTVDQTDKITWRLGVNEANQVSANIPSDPVIFAPRVIPLDFLEMLEPAQREAQRLHKTPDATAPFIDLPGDPEARFGFEVVEAKNDWMHVRLFPAGGDGWVPAHALATAGNLKGVFPELYFVDGLIGYLELSSASSRQSGEENRSIRTAAVASFDQYLELATGRAESEARALAAVLQGSTTLRADSNARWLTAQLQEAQRYFKRAKDLAPTSTIANNFFLACTAALCARGACDEGSDQLHAQFLNAIAQDPTSRELVDNLNAFYGAAQSGRIKVDLSPAKIAEQRAIIGRARSSMR